jgi:hypothetical protein
VIAPSSPLPDPADHTGCIAWCTVHEITVETIEVLRIDGRQPTQAEVDVVNVLGPKGWKRARKLRHAVEMALDDVTVVEDDEEADAAVIRLVDPRSS